MKNFTLILCSLLFSSVAFGQLNITVSFCDESPSAVRMTGPWWGWDPNGGPVAADNGDGSWTFTFDPVPTAKMEYKVVADGVFEDLTNEPCILDQNGYFNRFWYTTDPSENDITFGQCAACTTTGTETDLLSGLSIYPNPATDVLMISNDNTVDRVQMVNIFGSVVLDQNLQGTSGKLDISALSPGIYFVTVMSSNQQAVRKITVK